MWGGEGERRESERRESEGSYNRFMTSGNSSSVKGL